MQLNAVAGIVTLVVGIVLLIPLLIGAVFVVVVVANRADADPTGLRPGSVYAFATAFVSLFTALFATTAFVGSLAQLIGKHRSGASSGLLHMAATSVGGSRHPIGDAAARGAVLSGIVTLVAIAVFQHHVRTAAAATEGMDPLSPIARVRSSYVSAVAFLTVALFVIGTVVASYDVFRLIAPGVFSPDQDSRVAPLRSLLPAAWLAAGSLLILRAHLRHAPAPFRTLRLGGRTTPAAPAADPIE